MIPASFRYVRAGSVAEAVALLARHGPAAAPLAGGQSLLPAMRLRTVTPEVLVDLGPLPGLGEVRLDGDQVVVGALARYRDLETSELLGVEAPILRHVAHLVGDPQMRHRGTVGGALAHADPGSDLPAAALALAAEVVLEGPDGRRTVPAGDFFTGPGRTVRRPEEIVVELRLPRAAGRPWSYQRFTTRALSWPLVAVAAVGTAGGGPVRIGMAGMGPVPVRAAAAEAAATGPAAAAAAVAATGTDPPSDDAAGADYRRHLARVLTRRALEEVHRCVSP